MATVAQNITTLYGDQDAARAAQAQATQRPTAAPAPAAARLCPEAAFSLTLKGLLDGQEAMLTVRGQTPEEFTLNLQVVRGLFDRPVAPAVSNGSSPAGLSAGPSTTSVSTANAPVSPPQEREGWCGLHSVQMKLYPAKDGGKGWWSHKTEGGAWCKGRK
jgi:hypothetical protein